MADDTRSPVERITPEDLMRTPQNVHPSAPDAPLAVSYQQEEEASEQEMAAAPSVPSAHEEEPQNSGQEKAVSAGGSDSYRLGAGDKLKITVFGEDDLSGTYLVNDQGYISMPLIGEVKVGGMSVLEVRDRVRALFEEGYLKDPSIAIEVAEFRPVYIIGEVRNPGSYPYVTDMTILNAVAIAGGYTYRADKDDSEILRNNQGNSQVLEDMGENTPVTPGDIILIKERFF